MAILQIQGFDNFNNATEFAEDANWESAGAGGIIFSTTAGRFGGGALQFTIGGAGGDTHIARLTVSSAPSTIFVGFAIRKDQDIRGSENFLRFLADGNIHVNLRMDFSSRLIEVQTNPSGTIGKFYMSENAWHWVEMKVIIDDTVGEVTIRMDEVEVFTATGINTRNGAGDVVVNMIDFMNDNSNDIQFNIDDVIVHTEADFIGDTRIENLRPDADGDVSNFTPLSGTNWESVDEAPGPDDDTTYVESSTAGHQDLYTVGNIVGDGANIVAVQVKAYARKDDAGSRSIILLARENLTTGSGATEPLLTQYQFYNEVFELNPDTGSAWSGTEVNAMEIGMENL